MPIVVRHDLDPRMLSTLAYVTGAQEGIVDRDREDRRHSLALARMDLERELQDGSQTFRERLERQRREWDIEDSEADRENAIIDETRQREQFREDTIWENEQLLKRERKRLALPQQAKLDQIQDQAMRVMMDPSLTQDEKMTAMGVLRQRHAAVLSMPTDFGVQESRFAEGQDIGDFWTDEASGAILTRDKDGDVKVLVRPDQSPQIPMKDFADMFAKISTSLTTIDAEGNQKAPDPRMVERQLRSVIDMYNRVVVAPAQQKQAAAQGRADPSTQNAQVPQPRGGGGAGDVKAAEARAARAGQAPASSAPVPGQATPANPIQNAQSPKADDVKLDHKLYSPKLGRFVTLREVAATAAKRGMTVEEVMSQLGMRSQKVGQRSER